MSFALPDSRADFINQELLNEAKMSFRANGLERLPELAEDHAASLREQFRNGKDHGITRMQRKIDHIENVVYALQQIPKEHICRIAPVVMNTRKFDPAEYAYFTCDISMPGNTQREEVLRVFPSVYQEIEERMAPEYQHEMIKDAAWNSVQLWQLTIEDLELENCDESRTQKRIRRIRRKIASVNEIIEFILGEEDYD